MLHPACDNTSLPITLPGQKVRSCRVCGCTDDHACEGGCSWVTADLCSACYELMEIIPGEVAERIGAMPYALMLKHNRFAPAGDPMFQGDTGTYFLKVMGRKRDEIGPASAVAASKAIGWEREP